MWSDDIIEPTNTKNKLTINRRPHIIGVSMPVGFLSGFGETADDAVFQATWRNAAACLAELKDTGVTCIEIGYVPVWASERVIARAVEAIVAEELDVTIHLPDFGKSGRLVSVPSAVCELLQNRSRITVIVHAHGAEGSSMENIIDQNARDLEKLSSKFLSQGLFNIAVELRRDKGDANPSYSYDGLIRLLAQVDCSGIGFCWDVGHAYWNYLHSTLPFFAPSDFVNTVCHVHIHDISIDGKTHWPLSTGRLPLMHYLRQLAASSYSGVYIIELSPARWQYALAVREGINSSLSILNASLADIATMPTT